MTVPELLIQVRELQSETAQEITVIEDEIQRQTGELRQQVDLLEHRLETLEEIEEQLMGLVAVLRASVATGTWVSPAGNDSTGTGTEALPYLTIIKARDEIRLTNNVSPIRLEGGNYPHTSTISLTTADNNLTIQADGLATPILYGGDAITLVEGGSGRWTLVTATRAWDLIVQGERAEISALPVNKKSKNGHPYKHNRYFIATGGTGTTVTFTEGDIPSTVTTLGQMRIEVWGAQGNNNEWSCGLGVVTGIDHGTNTITFTGGEGLFSDPGQGSRFRLVNVPEQTGKTLQPGEWWHDMTGGSEVIQYQELDTSFNGSDVWRALVRNLFSSAAVGLTIGTGVEIRGGAPFTDDTNIGTDFGGAGQRQSINITGGDLTCTGVTFAVTNGGIGLRAGSNSLITGCTFDRLHHSGIVAAATAVSDVEVTLCTFKDLFDWYPSTHCIELKTGPAYERWNVHNNYGVRFSSRWYSYWDTIPVPGSDHIVTKNILIQGCLGGSDIGAIYGGDEDAKVTWRSSGHAWTNNYLEHIVGVRVLNSELYSNPQSFGLYADDGLSGVDISGNILNEDGSGIYPHNGREVLVSGNLTYENLYHGLTMNDSGSVVAGHTNIWSGNIVVKSTGDFVLKNDSDGDGNVSPHQLDNNNYFGAATTSGQWTNDRSLTYAQWIDATRQHDQNSIETDPVITDARKRDFTVGAAPKASPVLYVEPDTSVWGLAGLDTNSAYADLTGTVGGATEAQMVSGGRTIIITVTNGTLAAAGSAFNDLRQSALDALWVDGTVALAETNGIVVEVFDNESVANVVRTSDTVVTITLSAAAGYNTVLDEPVTLPYLPSGLVTGQTLPVKCAGTLTVTAD